jgi:hypothetical protein
MSIRTIAAVAAVVIAIAIGVVYFASPADEGAPVRKRLQAFADDINASTTDGQGLVARAVQLGSFFTDDIEIDLGQGSAPIRGRETVIGMAERLQPRTAAFTIRFEDVGVAVAPGGNTADVHLTAEFIRRSITPGEESMDAREFALGMRRMNGDWKIARVNVVETLQR